MTLPEITTAALQTHVNEIAAVNNLLYKAKKKKPLLWVDLFETHFVKLRYLVKVFHSNERMVHVKLTKFKPTNTCICLFTRRLRIAHNIRFVKVDENKSSFFTRGR
jgi:hypothetical protein